MSDFETWWQQEGQEFLYALNTTTDDDIKLVAEIAWKNGAYCAEQAEQEPAPWKHDCAALCMNDVELWIDNCPHCGKPRTSTTPPTAPNLNCKSVQRRLATSWGYVRKEEYDMVRVAAATAMRDAIVEILVNEGVISGDGSVYESLTALPILGEEK